MILIREKILTIKSYLILILFFLSCDQNHKNNDSLAQNEFSIKPHEQNIIQGNEGTILIIPAGALVYEDGSKIQEAVRIKLEEAYTLSDILAKNLDTRAGNQLLVTAGMINLDAQTVSGKKVVIANGKEINLQVARNSLDSNEYKFFTRGETGWENPQNPNPYLTYWPIEKHSKIYISLDTSLLKSWEALRFSRSKDAFKDFSFQDSLSLSTFLKDNYNIPDFITDELLDQSFISSKEYEDRFLALPILGERMIAVHLSYVKNLDKPLWVADSLAIVLLKEDLSNFEEEEKTGADYKFHLNCYNKLLKFKAERKTSFAKERLTQENREKLQAAYEKIAMDKLIQSFRIRTFGWHNIDFFYRKTELIPTVLVVDCNKAVQSVALVLADVKSVIQGTANSNNQFCFGFTGECETRLPHTKAYVIALGQEKGQLLFAQKEILIGQDKEVELDLQPSSKKEIKAVLDQIEKGYE